MNSPFFTIVTATYNAEKYLRQAMTSVTGQSYRNFQYILIDSKSKDSSVDIIKEFAADPRVEWLSEKDDGIYEAWNKGLKLARGEWIMFLGADDVLLEGALDAYAKFIAGLRFRPDHICSKQCLVKPDTLKVMRVQGSRWKWSEFRLVNHMAHPGALHNKALFAEVGIFDTHYKIVGDYELLLRKKNLLKSSFMDRVTVYARIGGVSAGKKALQEQRRAIVKTAGVSPVLARLNYCYLLAKLKTKQALLKMGINVYLRTAHSRQDEREASGL